MSTPTAGLASQTGSSPGVPVNAIAANQGGGYIVNPLLAADQGLANAEPLYVNQVGPADVQANGTTIALEPGQSYTVIPNTTTSVSVASNSGNHKFTAVQWV
jgi:D-lyxose ketol-isomerase